MIVLRTVLLIALLAAAIGASAQSLVLTDWNTYSSLNTVRAATVDPSYRIWCATSGGVFVHDPADGTTKEFRNIDALTSLDVTTIASDPQTGDVYVGAFDGSIDVVSSTFRWRSIRDIRRASQYQRRRINDLLVVGRTLYIATDFGIVTYDVERRLFKETVDRIGSLQEKTPVTSISILRDSIWAATPGGVVVAPLNVQTLRQPSVWRILDTAQGIATTGTTIVRTNGTSMFVVAGTNVLRYNGSRFDTLRTTLSPILNLSFIDDLGYISTEFGTQDVRGVPTAPWPTTLLGHTTYRRKDGTWEFVGFLYNAGLARMDMAGVVTPVVINSPSTAQFTDLQVDKFGNLWAASYNQLSKTGSGAAMFDGQTWRGYTSATSSIPTNSIYRISVLRDGRVILGTWGRGAYEIGDNGAVAKVYDQNTTALGGIDGDASFVLVGDAMLDRKGTLWMVNEQAGDRMLVSIDAEGTSRRYGYCSEPRNNYFRPLAIDAAGNKWLGGPGGNGVVAYNERSTPDDPSDDICVTVRSSITNLPDNVVNALTLDNNGALWIGTAKGVAVISAPTTVTSTTIPFVRRVSALSAVQVNDIYVDALNYKWVATAAGVFVLNEDGTEVLASISTSNSPILNDNVRSVTVDGTTGRAWFGMFEGLSSVQTQSITPNLTYDLRCYPQPYRPSDGSQLIIDGLASDSDVRILTPGGNLVQAMQTRGRQALWDGRDTQGRVVPPGVYIVHARSASSSEASVAKILVGR
ncbi:MAG: hypothetical protein FGM24_10865 [Candidatus Kapabacteria bacterium]|nr:hypothetical protein [Candidatus Kapabacteria bacterium]